MVVGEVVPGVAICAVVFADRAPLTLAEVWSPPFPACLIVFQTIVLGGLDSFGCGPIRHVLLP